MGTEAITYTKLVEADRPALLRLLAELAIAALSLEALALAPPALLDPAEAPPLAPLDDAGPAEDPGSVVGVPEVVPAEDSAEDDSTAEEGDEVVGSAVGPAEEDIDSTDDGAEVGSAALDSAEAEEVGELDSDTGGITASDDEAAMAMKSREGVKNDNGCGTDRVESGSHDVVDGKATSNFF